MRLAGAPPFLTNLMFPRSRAATGSKFWRLRPSGRRAKAILKEITQRPRLIFHLYTGSRDGHVPLDLDALTGCLASSACLVTQSTSGFIIGMLLFLVAVGLTLIFGVLKVVNFTHGAFYMFGAYFAMTTYQLTGSFALAMLCGAAGTAVLGLVFERVFISRVYGGDVLMQLLVCYAFVLIFDDVVRMIWGPEFKSMGMPSAFQVPPLFIAGGVVPPYYLLLIGVALAMAVILGLGLARTRIGKVIRAAAHNPGMVSALGINTGLIYGRAFVIVGTMAGLAGGLVAPVRLFAPGVGVSVLVACF